MNSVFTYTISVLEPQGPNAGHLSRERLFRLGMCCPQQGHTLPYLCDSCDGTGVERQIPPTPGIPFLALSVTPLWVQIWGVPATGGVGRKDWERGRTSKVPRIRQKRPWEKPARGANTPYLQPELSFNPLSLRLQPYRFRLHFPTFVPLQSGAWWQDFITFPSTLWLEKP